MLEKLKSLYRCAVDAVEYIDWLPGLVTRLLIGFVFLQSGWGKLHNLEGVVGFFTELGIPYPQLQAPFVAATEFGCGLLLMIGLASRLASIPLIGTMVVAIITAKKADIKEFSDLLALSEFTYILLFGWIIVKGPGCISVDTWIRKRFIGAPQSASN